MTYSTVVSRDSVRILLMIAALNDLDLQAADIQNAFLTAPNLEKCYMVAGPEFLDEEGKVFIVRRALYGLKSAPLAFKTYLGTGVSKKEIDGYTVWAISSFAYVKAAVKNVQEAIKNKPWKLPKRDPTPMTQSFIPELDDLPELKDDDRTYYQELVGVLRWATELGRVDILHEVSLLSQYQACPREGHMREIMHIFAFLRDHPKRSLYMDWTESGLDINQVRSSQAKFKQIYRNAKEELLGRMPAPRGFAVTTEAWVDASHAANRKTRKSHSGYIIFVNSAPIIWYSKRQNTIEASTFGSEFIALKPCIEAITHLRYKLRMFGVPLLIDQETGKAKAAEVICDNESVVRNLTMVESTLNKKHNSIAYHYVRWNVAAGVAQLSWMNGEYNLADLFTKRLGQDQRELLLGEFTY